MATIASGRQSAFEYPTPEIVECPYSFYRALREQAPVVQLASGPFLVSRWDDVVRVALDTETFSNFVGALNAGVSGGEKMVGVAEPGSRYTPWPLPFSDPPEHHLKRSLCLDLVARDRLRALEPVIDRLVNELIDGFVGRGEVEFASEFADLLPLRVMLDQFGIAREHEERLRQTRRVHGLGIIFGTEADRIEAAELRRPFVEFFRGVILERVEQPGDDFISHMIRKQVERDGELELSYLTAEVSNLFGAGNNTTAHMLANTMQLLCQHPVELERVLADRSLIRPMIDESLRVEGPIQWLQRLVTRDTEIGGVEIPEGSIVLIVWGSANRDEEKWEDPERFWIERPGVVKNQLGFGRGPHLCVGAPLARLEGRVAYEVLLSRLTNLRLSDRNDFTHAPGYGAQRGLNALYVEFDPA